jgi:hypothetical protein
MNGRFQMEGGKNWIFPKEMNANRFFWDSHWLEIWSNHFCPSMGPNGGSVAMDSVGLPKAVKSRSHAGHRVTKLVSRSTSTDDSRPRFTLKAEASCP